MSGQGEEQGNCPSPSSNPDGEVQLIETPKVDQPKFVTPTKDAQMVSVTPTIPPWLSNLVNNKRKLQLVFTPVKDIVTKYVARSSKMKKLRFILI